MRRAKGAVKLLWVIGFVILLFFLSDPLHIKPWITAILGATLGLLLLKPKIEEVCKAVEWPVLIFFAALFVTEGGLKHSGVLNFFTFNFEGIAAKNILLCGVVMIWVSAVAPLWWALALGVGFRGNGTPIGSTATEF